MKAEENTIEVLNYDSENRRFTKYSSNLGDIFTKIRKLNCWDLEDLIPGFELKCMKTVDLLFGDKDRTKLQSKKIKNNEDAELIKIIYNAMPKPKENQFKCNIKFDENNPKSLNIDYYCLQTISVIIMHILENIIKPSNFPSLLNEVLSNNFCRIMDISLWGSSLMKYKNDFNEVESLSFYLSTTHDDKFDINYTILFYYFFPVLFPKVKNVTINLNVNRINNIYNIDKNPYKIKECDVVEFSTRFENLFISNFIIINLISNIENLYALRILMCESFINEINYVFGKEFEKSNFKELKTKKLSLIYFRKLNYIKTVTNLSLTINSLDTFLFKEAINLVVLYRLATQLELELFSEPKYFNIRKIYLNYLTSQEFKEIDPNIVEKYQIIMYPYIESLDENILSLIEEEKIPDLLFPQFRDNINKLKLILNESAKNYQYFYLDISPYEELCRYDNYNIEILLFIFAVLSALKESTLLKTFKLKCLNINYSSVVQIKKNINKLINGELIDLSGCTQLENISLNMTGISLYLDLNKLPVNSLKIINIKISTLKDLEEFNSALKNQKNELVKLSKIKICLGINDNIQIFKEFLKIYDYLPPNLETFILTIENTIGKIELLQIMKCIYKNIDLTKEKSVNYILNSNSKELEAYLHDIKINNLKEYFMNNNGTFIEKCKYCGELTRRMNFTLIKWPQVDIIKSILFCFSKKINTNENNKIIYSKIFSFMGKSRNFDVNLS